jgi:hypothetical protein
LSRNVSTGPGGGRPLEPAPNGEIADQLPLHRARQPVHQGRDQVRFDEEFPRGSLYPQPTADPAGFLRESLLPLPRADVFDRAVGKKDLEAAGCEGQRAAVAGDEREACRLGRRRAWRIPNSAG